MFCYEIVFLHAFLTASEVFYCGWNNDTADKNKLYLLLDSVFVCESLYEFAFVSTKVWHCSENIIANGDLVDLWADQTITL